MNVRKSAVMIGSLMILMLPSQRAYGQPKPEVVKFEPFTWRSEPPADCPFERSRDLTGIRFRGLKSGFRYGDTWYPSWAADDRLYSPWTDGACWRLDGSLEDSSSGEGNGEFARTGQAVIEGNDPLDLKVYQPGHAPLFGPSLPRPLSLRQPGLQRGLVLRDLLPGPGRPRALRADYGELALAGAVRRLPRLRRTSARPGRKPRTPPTSRCSARPASTGYPVKIGSPHFVDFGKDMQHSPDGKAYLVAHGADSSDPKWRFWNASWITGDQVYLLRVTPSPETMNDASKYEFYAGRDAQGKPVWTVDFSKIKPLLEWNNNMGCVTVTYDAPLKKYLMFVTDGGNTCARMNTYLLESDAITGPWRLVSYMKDFGEQAYFVNIPSKFISADGRTMWLLYSTNFAADWNGEKIGVNPPGGHYGLVLQKIELLGPR